MPAKKTPKPSDKLKRYREMRSAEGTLEPMGGASHRPRMFVVQKHAATRLHYDFRLEWGGTLVSWAVPRGPSPNPTDSRMAVHVEDHPVEYADFEGVIPKGNYGAGEVIVWDKGLWVPIDNPDESLPKGKLHFILHGYKLQGEWYLVRTSRDPNGKDWLLKKKKDVWVNLEENPYSEESILSGLTLEEMRDGQTRTREIKQSLARSKTPKGVLQPLKMELMLARTRDEPFTDRKWIYELKYDGYRLIAARDAEGQVVLRSRNGHDLCDTFPDLARAIRALPYRNLVLDGELTVLDEAGHPSFSRLQKRSKLTRTRDIERATVELPATLFVFDLLGFEGYDLRSLPLLKRKAHLPRILPKAGPLRYADHIPEQGEAMYAQVRAMQLEGIMAKKADTPYVGGRSDFWLKIKADKVGDFVVCGYTRTKGSRSGFGALHLGAYLDGTLTYVGRVGTGFSDAELGAMREALDAHPVKRPSCKGPSVPTGRDHVWVRPEMVIEVRYKTITPDGHLRHPAFLRLREDKEPLECTLEGAVPEEPTPLEEDTGEDPPGSLEPVHTERIVRLSNLKKVFWPQEKYSKGDLVDYYRAVAPYMLPYLRNRPLVLTRYPDGIEGKSFYQKNVPDFLPSWIRTVTVYSESSEKEIRYMVCDDEETLLYTANMAAIPLHLWMSRVDTIQQPDWCLIDLDPKGAPFEHVRILALATRDLCDEIGLSSYVKTSGSTGLHVLIPLGAQVTYEQCRMLANLLAKVIESRHKDIATTARAFSRRKGKVYLDFLQNRYGQLMVSPYCVRPLPGAPVSAPLEWKEVNARLTPQKFTIKNLLTRLKRRKTDPLLPVLTEKPDLVAALAKLAKIVG